MLKKIKPKTMKTILTCTRGIIQLAFFIFFPAAFTSAYAGVKYIFDQLGAGKSIEFTSFVFALVALCVFTVVFGRFFCGYACAFGTVGDALHSIYLKICKKLKKKPFKLPEKSSYIMSLFKYIVLLAVVTLCFTSFYSKTRGMSPWDVFSMLRAGNIHISAYIIGTVILIILIVGMTFIERFFCRFFCPMGAVFSLLPIIPVFTLHRNKDNCIKGCNLCERNCPCNVKLPDKNGYINGECVQCQKCIGACPKKNISTRFEKLKGNEILFTFIRAILLVLLFIWVGL